MPMLRPNIGLAGDVRRDPELLSALNRLYDDPKDAVDAPLACDQKQAHQRWENLGAKPNRERIQNFAQNTFLPPGSDLQPWYPSDHSHFPALLSHLDNDQIRKWASHLNDSWLELGRQPSELTLQFPERSTLLSVPHPFIIPGGRFREAYYWDSYWVVLGLIACDMLETSHNIVNNLLHCVDKYGFVPNGLRRCVPI